MATPSSPTDAAPPINCKLLIIGNSSVGKSSLLLRFTDKQWLPRTSPARPLVCKMEVGGKRVKLSIWDTAGQERFRTITSSYYRGAQGIFLVYDVSSRESFEALPRWFSELEQYVSPSVVKILVGNKLDKEFSRTVSRDEGAKFADRMGCLFMEASAKTATGVREAFVEVVEKIIDTPELWQTSGPGLRSAGPRPGSNNAMPGGIQLDKADDSSEVAGGCSC
ncbi:ras-domain-containing protein [Auriculariales sp. MPI-PUGE-AT-0066]|nr:ras-domain-containing protein [Auriculariales sp. MPI-PUGE-AT-0066]